MRKLLDSIERGDVDAVRSLLSDGVSVERGRWRRLWARSEPSPLQRAVQLRATAIAACLLDHGADPNAGTPFALLPLPSACYNGDLATMTLLVSYGAEVNPRGAKAVAPLVVAATSAHESAVEWLLVHGADPSAVFASHVSLHQISGQILARIVSAGGEAPLDVELAVRQGKW